MTVPAVTKEQRLSLGLEGLGMVGVSGSLKVATEDSPSFLDITDRVAEFVQEAGVALGLVVVFSRHTTAAVVLNENEPLLMQDVAAFLEKLAPRDGQYRHNDFTIRTVNMNADECPNGHAHLQHWLLGSTEVIPIVAGEMALGRWQRIFLVELDRPRERELVVQVWGIAVQAPDPG
jgi:secondary thiamine-phosphate synthase enzyme